MTHLPLAELQTAFSGRPLKPVVTRRLSKGCTTHAWICALHELPPQCSQVKVSTVGEYGLRLSFQDPYIVRCKGCGLLRYSSSTYLQDVCCLPAACFLMLCGVLDA